MSSVYSNSDVIDDLRVEFPDTTSFPNSRIERFIRFVIQDIVTKAEIPEFEERGNLPTTLSVSTRRYSISSLDALAILSVKDTTSDLNLQPLTIQEAEDWDETDEGEPSAYLRFGEYIEIYPLPSSDYSGDSVRVRYLKRPSSISEIPEEYDEAVLNGVRYHAYKLNSEEDKAAAAFRQYQGVLNARRDMRGREAQYTDRIIYPSQIYFKG